MGRGRRQAACPSLKIRYIRGPIPACDGSRMANLLARRSTIVAREGLPWLATMLIAAAIVGYTVSLVAALLPLTLFAFLFAIFRDPRRLIPAAPLGIVSPVDGQVTDVALTDKGILGFEAQRVVLQVDSWGTYTARCPTEGKIMDFRGDGKSPAVRSLSNGLWVQTDEGDDVVLQFHGHRLGLAPRAFLRYGERVGQGQRCAYLRLTKFAEVQFPLNSRVLVSPGDTVLAGSDVLAKLPPT